VTPLHEAHERARYGGKAVGLARLLAAGLPVPGGFALAPDRLRAVRDDPHEAWSRASALGSSFALRSSALDEDSSAASFAGQHESVLGVGSAASLAEAAERVIASGEASRAYREAKGIGGESVLAGVLQLLVEPVSSGVLFTRDPISGAERTVIEASWGLGEVVVQGLVEPDRFVLDRSGVVLEAHVGLKDIRVRPGGVEEEVPVAEQEIACTPRAVAEELARLVEVCERVAEGPADVEWAWDGSTLWLLQCRAITTL
jgi:pyruvate,water dikinase